MFRNNLYTYSFIKTLYDKKRDYLDSFSPLIYSVVTEEDFTDVESVQKKVQDKYDLKFPLHLITTVVSRGKRQGLLGANPAKNNQFKLTETGVKYVAGIESTDDVARRINSLGADLIVYFGTQGHEKTKEEVATLLQSFIHRNIGYFVDILGTNGTDEVVEIKKDDESILLDYIQTAMESKPDQYNTLKEMIYGSIISSLVYVRNTTELTELEEKSFKSARIYLDTNIIFSALGFHTEEMKQSATELLDLITSAGLELWAFEFTVDEICGFFRAYASEGHKYPSGIKVDFVLSNFKQKGLGLSDINEMVVKIEHTLNDIGIRVDPTPDVSLKDYQSPSEVLQGRVSAEKTEKPLTSINHDIAAIDYIRKFRRGNVRSIEDPKAIFLTADNSLNRACMNTFNHTEKGTLPETILDRLFANILWLKNPDIDLPINLIIASHSRDLLVDRAVWERFYSVLNKLKTGGEITEDQAATLFYKNQIEDSLREVKKSDLEKITDKFVTEEIEKAAKVVEDENATLNAEKKMLEQSLFETNEQIREAQSATNKIQEVRERIKVSAKRYAWWAMQISVVIVSALLIFIEGMILLSFHRNGIEVTGILLTIFLALVFGGTGSFMNWKICEYVKVPIYKKVYSFSFSRKMKILE